jgi:hypothetical protein
VSGGFTVIRGGRVVDGAGRQGEPADLLIEGDTIRTVGPAGRAAPEGATVVDAADKLLIPGLGRDRRIGGPGPDVGACRLQLLQRALQRTVSRPALRRRIGA